MSRWLMLATEAAGKAQSWMEQPGANMNTTARACGWVELGRLYTELHHAELLEKMELVKCLACPPDCNECSKDESDCECYTHQNDHPDTDPAQLSPGFPQDPAQGDKHTDADGVIYLYKGWEVWDNTAAVSRAANRRPIRDNPQA